MVNRLFLFLAMASAVCAREGPAPDSSSYQNLLRLSTVFRQAYEQALPAVVLINTSTSSRATGPRLPHPLLPEEDATGLGSGIIVHEDGYILSNHHVIAGADSIRVTLADRRMFSAKVIGADSLIDIALLKIEAQQLPVLQLRQSDDLQIGDWVLAIGHPLGMGATLTHGIVSALGRRARIIDDAYGVESFIQTDAVINPGNSGGPLLNLYGEVVGINTAISTRTGFFMGYGLAIPVELARSAMEDIRVHGRVLRGYLGISMSEMTPEILRVQDLDMDRPRGLLLSILPDSPAEYHGLEDGDILLSVNGQDVDLPNQVQSMIYRMKPGNSVILTILRDRETMDLQVVLGKRELETKRLASIGTNRLDALGLSVQGLCPASAAELGFDLALASQLGFDPGQAPVLIVGIESGSEAERRRLRLGDVITDVDETRIVSEHVLIQALAELMPNERAIFWLWRPDYGVDLRVITIRD